MLYFLSNIAVSIVWEINVSLTYNSTVLKSYLNLMKGQKVLMELEDF